jgi:Zn-dependent M16 (insulinase) family peptidase
MQPQELPILFHDIPTNGIAYLDMGFDMRALPQKYLSYIPLLGRAFLEMGTEKEDYVTLTQRISRKTGGIRPKPLTSSVQGSDAGLAWLFLRGKAMQSQTRELLDILRDVLLTVRLDNRERFRQMVLEEKARQEQQLVPVGHQVVDVRIRSHFSEADWVAEQMGGVDYLFFLRRLARMIDEEWPTVLDSLEDIRRILINKKAMLVNATMSAGDWVHFEPQLNDFLTTIPSSQGLGAAEWSQDPRPEFEGLTMPIQVNYVGKGTDLYKLGYRFRGSALVITRYIRTSWLWDRVRVQGGAYGGFCSFNRLSGVLTFVSYRDPNLLKTIEAFDDTAKFLKNIELSPEDLAKSIIGAIGDLDTYMLPDAKGFISMVRYLTGDTDENRQRLRDEIFGTTIADFKAFGELLGEVNIKGIVKVLGSQSAIEEAVGSGPGKLNILKVL